MKHTPIIPPLAPDDHLPDDRAVWRDPPCQAGCPGFVGVTVEYAGGMKERTTVAKASWRQVTRWRFGWSPAA